MTVHQTLPGKPRIARSFGNAAANYDHYARLQRTIGDRLLDDAAQREARRILDIGSGTGYCAAKLAGRFPGADITSLDIAEAMLVHARKGNGRKDDSWICGDAEALPFKEASFDLVVSNLTLQWCPSARDFFAELFRVMRPGARALVSTLGAGTLAELRNSWASIDDEVHVNSFLPGADIAAALRVAPFATVDIVNDTVLHYYDSLASLMTELKGIGAHNLNEGRPTGLTAKSKLVQLKAAFEGNAVPGKGIPVTYELVLLRLAKGSR